MKYILYKLIVIMAMVPLAIGCAAPMIKTENKEIFSVNAQKTLDELGPFNFERRITIYETIDLLANKLKTSNKPVLLKKEKSKISGELLKMVPTLSLYDEDMDGKADSFAYFLEKEKDTQEFGFIFDLNRDGKIDYIVYNCGPALTKDLEFFWANYHWIDSNYDGKIDIHVYNNNIDLSGDKYPERGVTAWLYDTNFDGLIDKAEYCGKDFVKSIEKKEGVFIIKTMFGDEKWEGSDFKGEDKEKKYSDFKNDSLENQYFFDINSLLI